MPVDAAPAALLWDFDGTLADTEPSWRIAERRFLAELGVEVDPVRQTELIGLSTEASAARMLGWAGRDDFDPVAAGALVEGYAFEVISSELVPFRPGARELLADARAAGVPCALVSASSTRILRRATRELPEGSFDAVIGGDTVTHGKPHPEPYLRGAAALGVEPGACLALEDSRPGLASAEAAGVPSLGIPFAQELAPGERQRIVRTLDGVGFAEASALWRELTDA
ncbi:HAD family hydrolase [Propioniciclava soli]|uniref:HAD family hydrolase n=1 Tax=Propioniciclava soli TaxID=2775081 RepID=UPI001E4A1AEC|nr:HAD family phosphatase [Propioniciclava soli]